MHIIDHTFVKYQEKGNIPQTERKSFSSFYCQNRRQTEINVLKLQSKLAYQPSKYNIYETLKEEN